MINGWKEHIAYKVIMMVPKLAALLHPPETRSALINHSKDTMLPILDFLKSGTVRTECVSIHTVLAAEEFGVTTFTDSVKERIYINIGQSYPPGTGDMSIAELFDLQHCSLLKAAQNGLLTHLYNQGNARSLETATVCYNDVGNHTIHYHRCHDHATVPSFLAALFRLASEGFDLPASMTKQTDFRRVHFVRPTITPILHNQQEHLWADSNCLPKFPHSIEYAIRNCGRELPLDGETTFPTDAIIFTSCGDPDDPHSNKFHVEKDDNHHLMEELNYREHQPHLQSLVMSVLEKTIEVSPQITIYAQARDPSIVDPDCN